MARLLPLFLCLLTVQAHASLLFYATNNLSMENFGLPGDELIAVDFFTADYTPIGVITTGGGEGINGVTGLDWECGVGCGDLIGAVEEGSNGVYAIDPATAQATLLGNAPAGLTDLAYNPVSGKMYGSDGQNNLWRDDDGDSIPETNVGMFNTGGLEVGLGFDDGGNLFVQDIDNDAIYRGTGDNPDTLLLWVTLPYDANFSQGLYVGPGQGFHAAQVDEAVGNDLAENYVFNTAMPAEYTLVSAFANLPSGLPEVEIGDLTPLVSVPEPGTALLLGMGLLSLGWRHRRAQTTER